GALAETGRRSRVSTRYLKKTPAWPELPRPHTTHKGAEPIPTRCAMSRVARRLRTILATTSALSPISFAIADIVTAQPLHLACAPPLPWDAGHDAAHDAWRARQTRAEGCRHSFSEWSRHQPCRPPAPEGLPS